MAYFANGTDGAMFDEQCDNCIHGLKDDILCPVAAVQLTYNYDQTDNPTLRSAMFLLVDALGHCQMRKVMKEVGVKFDFSERNQGKLF